jgi:pimeloyl-ACP methyl ester carboxylesterase
MSRRTVLVHAGICDARMWDGFELPGELVKHQLPAPLGESFDGEPAALVGNSYGGFVSLEFAAREPQLVEKLVLLDAPLMDHEFSDEFMAYVNEEERLLEAGDTDAAVELNLDFWCPRIADRVRPMLPGSLELENEELEQPDLGTIRAPTLVAVGEHDKPDFIAIAERLARELPDAEFALIEGAGHLPPLERPAETAALVRRFISG